MTAPVTISVATFGDEKWADIARRRAIPCAESFGVPVLHVHGETLHDARNEALQRVETDFVIQLDADDELAPGYVDAMLAGTCDVRVPWVSYVKPMKSIRVPARASDPMRWYVWGHHEPGGCAAACLAEGNWCPVGSMVRTDLARRVGWRDWPMWEDYDFWCRVWQAGGTFEWAAGAVYRYWVGRTDNRNKTLDFEGRKALHMLMAAANGLPAPDYTDRGIERWRRRK
ncbi:MAG TPA: glycosyltransferase [Micromonosporaceae bacterium]